MLRDRRPARHAARGDRVGRRQDRPHGDQVEQVGPRDPSHHEDRAAEERERVGARRRQAPRGGEEVAETARAQRLVVLEHADLLERALADVRAEAEVHAIAGHGHARGGCRARLAGEERRVRLCEHGVGVPGHHVLVAEGPHAERQDEREHDGVDQRAPPPRREERHAVEGVDAECREHADEERAQNHEPEREAEHRKARHRLVDREEGRLGPDQRQEHRRDETGAEHEADRPRAREPDDGEDGDRDREVAEVRGGVAQEEALDALPARGVGEERHHLHVGERLRLPDGLAAPCERREDLRRGRGEREQARDGEPLHDPRLVALATAAVEECREREERGTVDRVERHLIPARERRHRGREAEHDDPSPSAAPHDGDGRERDDREPYAGLEERRCGDRRQRERRCEDERRRRRRGRARAEAPAERVGRDEAEQHVPEGRPSHRPRRRREQHEQPSGVERAALERREERHAAALVGVPEREAALTDALGLVDVRRQEVPEPVTRGHRRQRDAGPDDVELPHGDDRHDERDDPRDVGEAGSGRSRAIWHGRLVSGWS